LDDPLDIELKPAQEPESEPPDRRPPPGVWVAAGLLVVAALVAAYFTFSGGRSEPPPQTVEAPPAQAPEAPPEPLGGQPEPIVLPPLDESDALVRELIAKLSSHPRVAAWLATEGLIRNFAVVVTNIADGATPAGHLKALAPSGSFRFVERGGGMFVDPRSYDRYATLADATGAIDPKGAAALYATLKPRIEEAYRELGFPDTPFDRTLERALVRLLGTPIPDDPIAVEPRGIVYGYADERLENLSAAQKQLLRMGPRNARVVQRSLREIALALGIPIERLPPPPPVR
jgi:hypothetical protein